MQMYFRNDIGCVFGVTALNRSNKVDQMTRVLNPRPTSVTIHHNVLEYLICIHLHCNNIYNETIPAVKAI